MDRRRRVRNGKTLVMVLLVTCCSVSYCKVADTIAVAIFNRRSSVRTPTAVRPSLGLFILSNDQSWNSDRSRASELWWEAKGGIHEELSSDGSSRYSRLGMTDGKHARSSYPIGYFSLLSSFCKGGSSFCQVSQSHLYFEPCYRDSFAIVCSQRENATRMFFCSLSNLHSASNSETSYDPRKDRSSKGSIDHLLERGEESVYVYTRQTNRTVLDTRDSSISVFASTVARYVSSVSRIFHSTTLQFDLQTRSTSGWGERSSTSRLILDRFWPRTWKEVTRSQGWADEIGQVLANCRLARWDRHRGSFNFTRRNPRGPWIAPVLSSPNFSVSASFVSASLARERKKRERVDPFVCWNQPTDWIFRSQISRSLANESPGKRRDVPVWEKRRKRKEQKKRKKKSVLRFSFQ